MLYAHVARHVLEFTGAAEAAKVSKYWTWKLQYSTTIDLEYVPDRVHMSTLIEIRMRKRKEWQLVAW